VEISELAAEKLFSPAALSIIRRHRPDSEDGRYCRGCGRPVADCDVLALAHVVAADLRTSPRRILSVGQRVPAEALAAAVTASSRADVPEPTTRRRATRDDKGVAPQPEVAPA
jgi:hypothetical protein